ncbi:MAG: tetratricopeptide repeat protein [Candidatus Paceibacterota bacterium]|jgi:tetratricopeptide (TPR) repeat protein
MEFDLIPQVIIMIASGVIIVILGRNIPKLKDDASDGFWSGNYNEVEKREREKFQYLYERLVKKISKEEYKKKMDLFWIWFEKLLRKARINFLKFDNTIVALINKLREKNVEKIEKLFNDNEEKDEHDVKTGSNAVSAGVNKAFGKVRKFDWKNINKHADMQVPEKKAVEPEEPVFSAEPEIREGSANIVSEKISDIVPGTAIVPETAEAVNEINEKNADAEDIVENLGDERKTNKEKEYIKMIMKNPIDVKAYWHLGTIYARRRNYKDAIECFRQITKIDPTYEKAKHKLTEILGKMKKGVRRGKEDSEDQDEEKGIDPSMPT